MTMNNTINKILKEIDFENNKLIKINNNICLTQNQINILEKYNIEYHICNSIRDIMIKIEDILNYNEIEELEILLENLNERQYYEEINK